MFSCVSYFFSFCCDYCVFFILYFFFFFKQKTEYEMRISDWSSDVCSSDLIHRTVTVTRSKRPRRVSRVIAAPSPSSRAARRARIFALQSETAPGWRLIAAGAGFPLSAAKTALSASSTSSLAFTEELLWSPAAARQWPARSEEHTSDIQSLMPISHPVFYFD